MSARYAVGIVHYAAYDALERCLEAVAAQSLAPLATCVIDADSSDGQLEALRRRHSTVSFAGAPNRGYAGGANAVLRRLAQAAPDAEFVLLLNPDVELRVDHAARLVAAMSAVPSAALASGKLLRRDGRRIDSAGIWLPRNRRPRDRGSEQADCGQFERAERVFGATGAALMLRCAALEELRIEGELFDEDFFLYHEDTDLAWRANLFGWCALYVPDALALHERGWKRAQRSDVPVHVRRHSFKNHYLQMIKNERGGEFARDLPVIVAWEALRFGFALLRDPALLPAYRDAWRLSGRAWRKRRVIQARRSARAPIGARGGSPVAPPR